MIDGAGRVAEPVIRSIGAPPPVNGEGSVARDDLAFAAMHGRKG
jgi:hypothetical protein